MIHVDRYEKIWMTVSFVTLALFLVAIAGSVLASRIQLPGAEGHVNMAMPGGGSAGANPAGFEQQGLRQTGDQTYDLYIVARTWSFTPNEVRVPAGATVNIIATSLDVTHGLMILNTNVNVMLLPGQISRVTVRFANPGVYPFVCHEYCGIGHQAMSGKIIVE